MRKLIAALLLSFACAAALAGCRYSYTQSGNGGSGAGGVSVGFGGAEGVDSLVPALNSFTEELLSKVDSAPDKKAGAADAQGLLHSRGEEWTRRIAAFKRGAQQDSGAKARWLEAEVDNTDRVHRLQLKYADEAAHDPVLKLRLEQLIADYDAMFKDR
jgi:hypothetical protein